MLTYMFNFNLKNKYIRDVFTDNSRFIINCFTSDLFVSIASQLTELFTFELYFF